MAPTLRIFNRLTQIADFRRRHLPFIQTLEDLELVREIGQAITLTRALRRWRDLAGVPVKQVLTARADDARPHELVSRLARVEFSEDGGEPIATVGGVELLETAGIDPDAVRARIEERREKLRAEVKRGEGKLSNEGFVAKAPADVVDAEREKLAAYRAELEELGG